MGFLDDLVEAGLQYAKNKVKNVIQNALTEQELKNCKRISIAFEHKNPTLLFGEIRNQLFESLLEVLGNLIGIRVSNDNRFENWDWLFSDDACIAFIITNGRTVIKFGLYGTGQPVLCISGEKCVELVNPACRIFEKFEFLEPRETDIFFNQEPPFHESQWMDYVEQKLKERIKEKQLLSSNSNSGIAKTGKIPAVIEFCTGEDKGCIMHVFFHNDNTFTMELEIKRRYWIDYISGTYSGDVRKNGIVSLSIKKIPDEEDFESKMTALAENGLSEENCSYKWVEKKYSAEVEVCDGELTVLNCDSDFNLNGLIFSNVDDNGGIVSKWSGVKKDKDGCIPYFYFYGNNTFRWVNAVSNMKIDSVCGTYSGDTDKNGTVKINIKKRITKHNEWEERDDTTDVVIIEKSLIFFKVFDGTTKFVNVYGGPTAGKKSEIITKWNTEKDEDDDTYHFYFYDDGTFRMEYEHEDSCFDLFTGVYSGDTTKGGAVKINIRKEQDTDVEEFVLKDCDYTKNVDINEETLTFCEDDEHEPMTFKKQINIEKGVTAWKSEQMPQKQVEFDIKTQIQNMYRKSYKQIGKKASLVALAFERFDKLMQVTKGYAKKVGMNERPILIYDNSTGENCKAGFFITDKKIYAKNSFSFSSITMDIPDENDLASQNGVFQKLIIFNGKEVETEQIGGVGTEQLFKLVKFIVAKIKKHSDFSCIPTMEELFNDE